MVAKDMPGSAALKKTTSKKVLRSGSSHGVCFYLVIGLTFDIIQTMILTSHAFLLSRNMPKNRSGSTRRFATDHVGIIGGGLAGLSTAFHLLEKSPSTQITIIDKELPGEGGASSVAGGLVHPLSPRGKLAFRGLEGLARTNLLIETAMEFESDTVLRNEIYRVATNEDHVSSLKQTASNLPDLAEWIEVEGLSIQEPDVLGALRLHSGCRVVHMNSYLKGLWAAIEHKGKNAEWHKEPDCISLSFDWKERLSSFDTVVLCAGAGLFQNCVINDSLPLSLVRGQSVELKLDNDTALDALLCGKYLSPLPEKNRALIGATQEFADKAFDAEKVEEELKQRSSKFLSSIWNMGSVDRITEGFRVQSNRGKHGRLPILGSIQSPLHDNTWIFTGLSSRGLLYHGIFGDTLTDMILGNEVSESEQALLNWWKK